MTRSLNLTGQFSRGAHSLRTIGAAGSVLALVILGASVLLRLTTALDADGTTTSNMAPAYENAIRLVHRLAAAGLGLLALIAAILAWACRRTVPMAIAPVIWIVLATLLLAGIGPLTSGYRYGAVTIANVVAGTILLVSCWWLWEAIRSSEKKGQKFPPLVGLALAVFLAHVSLGAAASFYAMHGMHWVSFLHAGSAMFATMLMASILWDRGNGSGSSRLAVSLEVMLAAQVALGLISLWIDVRPVGLAFAHAMLSPLLFAGLVSITARRE